MKIKTEEIIGAIFCIPLFMSKEDWGLKEKLSKEDLEKEFAFGRCIETNSSMLVEIFNYIGSAKTDLETIINSGVMFSPLLVMGDGLIKKRWKIIGKTKNYDKYIHSNYKNLRMVFGIGEDFRLRDFSTKTEIPITRKELDKYEFSVVWFPIDLEERIIDKLK